MVNREPDILDRDKFGMSAAARVLGISRKTLKTRADEGVIKCYYGKNRKTMFYGSELKKLWRIWV